MPFLQLTRDIATADPAPFEDALFDLGALSVTLEDAADDPVLDPSPGERPLWPTRVVKALFDASASRDDLARFLAHALPDTATPRFEPIADKAWEPWLAAVKVAVASRTATRT